MIYSIYFRSYQNTKAMEIIIFFICMSAVLIGLAGLCDYLTEKLK
jgi:ABC-type uncharacterized transport system permease subunit